MVATIGWCNRCNPVSESSATSSTNDLVYTSTVFDYPTTVYLDSGTTFTNTNSFTFINATSSATTITLTFGFDGVDVNSAWARLTPEERRALDEATAREQQRLTIIERKGEKLLRHLLTSRQRRTWERFRYITVPSHINPGVVYRIPHTGMIRMFQDGKPVKDLCVYPVEALPIGDKVAVFKLMIESDEQELHRIAAVHAIRQRSPIVEAGGVEFTFAGQGVS